MNVKVRRLDKVLPLLEQEERGDWIDIRASRVKKNGLDMYWDDNNSIHYDAGDFLQVYVGFAMELPKGYEAHTAPRGSTFKNYGLIQTNSVGVIDESYNGDEDEWFIPFYAMRAGVIEYGDRVAQFRIIEKMPKLEFVVVSKLGNENRGGFGSSGKR